MFFTMETKMEKLMDNPYAWALLSLCTIISFLFAIYTWIVERKIKEISIDSATNEIIKQGKYPISKLDIKFDGKQIQDLSSSIFYIWNSGNDVINATDIVVSGLLKISCESGNILDARIIRQSDESNNFLISKFTSDSVEITFEYMDRGEGITLQILHMGCKDELSFICKIKGGNPIRDCLELRKNKGIKGFFTAFIDEMMPIFFCIFGFFVPAIVLEKMGISYKSNQILVALISILFVLLLMIFYIKIKKKIKEVFHRGIPNVLKK